MYIKNYIIQGVPFIVSPITEDVTGCIDECRLFM